VSTDKLTARQAAFVRHYVAGDDGVRGNAAQAAIAAGFSKGSAHVRGHRLLNRPAVAIEIAGWRAEAEEAAGIRLIGWMELAPEAQRWLIRIMRGLVHHKAAEPMRRAAALVLERALGKVTREVHHTGLLTIDQLLDATEEPYDPSKPPPPAP